MAKLGKSRPAKAKKPAVTEIKAPKKSVIAKARLTVVKGGAKKLKAAAPAKAEAKVAVKGSAKADVASHQKAAAPQKKVSEKLLETIEKRRKAQAVFARPMGRRGRRPKNAVEYTPEHQEEDVLVAEENYEGLEYDTGIRVKQAKDEGGFNLDRFEEFDEELNFDW